MSVFPKFAINFFNNGPSKYPKIVRNESNLAFHSVHRGESEKIKGSHTLYSTCRMISPRIVDDHVLDEVDTSGAVAALDTLPCALCAYIHPWSS
jgi:hypothetical protein